MWSVVLGALLTAAALYAPSFLPLLAASMRSPDGGPFGWFAQSLMTLANVPTIADAVTRLAPSANDELWVEIGAAHGYGLKEVFKRQRDGDFDWPQRIVAVEISKQLREDYLTPLSHTFDGVVYYERKERNWMPAAVLKQATDNYPASSADTRSLFELYSEDAKDMRSFLRTSSVDKLLAVNVVYFLDPLEDYMHEIARVLKPGGKALFACKFDQIQWMPSPPFINKEAEAVMAAILDSGLEADLQPVDLGDPKFSYSAITITKPLGYDAMAGKDPIEVPQLP